MPLVQVELRRRLLERNGPTLSRAIHEGLVEDLDMAGLRHDDFPVSVDDVGCADWYAGGRIDEEVQR